MHIDLGATEKSERNAAANAQRSTERPPGSQPKIGYQAPQRNKTAWAPPEGHRSDCQEQNRAAAMLTLLRTVHTSSSTNSARPRLFRRYPGRTSAYEYEVPTTAGIDSLVLDGSRNLFNVEQASRDPKAAASCRHQQQQSKRGWSATPTTANDYSTVPATPGCRRGREPVVPQAQKRKKRRAATDGSSSHHCADPMEHLSSVAEGRRRAAKARRSSKLMRRMQHCAMASNPSASNVPPQRPNAAGLPRRVVHSRRSDGVRRG